MTSGVERERVATSNGAAVGRGAGRERGARRVRRGRATREIVWVAALGGGFLVVSGAVGTIPTTIADFFMPGTQPGQLGELIADSFDCMGCHGNYDLAHEPLRNWAASMMGQSARDPIFYAALAIANQDAAFAGEFCIRCHAPGGWLAGNSVDPSGALLAGSDLQGVSCNFCHRMVDPVYRPGVSPPVDAGILAQINPPPITNPHSAGFVVDPEDRRRGPLNLGPNFMYHQWAQAGFQSSSSMCATCHDVSNPAFTRQPSGSYALNALNTAHPTGQKQDMFPIERTYSEWTQSDFARGPVNVNGRFGGTLPAVSSCQDCHMPTATAKNCSIGPVRNDSSTHAFNGGNTWVLKAIRSLYPDYETMLSEESVNQSIARTEEMLRQASDMELSLDNSGGPGTRLKVRVINWSGHKLPTGYPEGRRVWVNVQFLGPGGQIVAERGRYDSSTAVLSTGDTKVYEAKIGVDEAVSQATGIPVGPGFHFAVNNTWYLDNRIPPRGFTNAGFASVQAAPVNYAYADGQHWDDTLYAIPATASSARVTVYYQLTSKEYIEFLRDRNTTNNKGQIAYDQWVLHGKSAPVAMDAGSIALPGACYANCDESSASPRLTPADFVCFLNRFRAGDSYANCDGSTGTPSLTPADFVCFLGSFRAGC